MRLIRMGMCVRLWVIWLYIIVLPSWGASTVVVCSSGLALAGLSVRQSKRFLRRNARGGSGKQQILVAFAHAGM